MSGGGPYPSAPPLAGMPGEVRTAVESVLLARVDRSGGPDACWPWTGHITERRPYGQFSRCGFSFYAHRAAADIAGLGVRRGLDVCHRCDNPPCCNPAHLFVATHRENLLDAAAKGRTARPWAKLSAETAREIRRRSASGEATGDLAREFGVSASAIRAVVRGESWRGA